MDKKKFFDSVRGPVFGGKLTFQQVSGTDLILDTWATGYVDRSPPTQLAYMLATAFWESGRTMQPIAEHGNAAYFTRLYDIRGERPALARRMGNVNPGDGIKYRGRGLVQLTWKLNYELATAKLWALGKHVDLVGNPDQAMQPDIAILVMFEGMESGWFTGRDLDDYIDSKIDGDEHEDYLKARKIINGTDRQALIAGFADKFLTALKEAA